MTAFSPSAVHPILLHQSLSSEVDRPSQFDRFFRLIREKLEAMEVEKRVRSC
jgi:hypothetical protein